MTARFKAREILFFAAVFLVTLVASYSLFTKNAFAVGVEDPTPVSPVVISQLTPQMVAGLLGALIPVLVSLLARSGANATVKTWLNLVLTAALAAVSTLVVPTQSGEAEFGWVPFLMAWLYAFISSTVSYLGGLKNFRLNDVLLAIGGLFGQKAVEPTPEHSVDVPADPTTSGGTP